MNKNVKVLKIRCRLGLVMLSQRPIVCGFDCGKRIGTKLIVPQVIYSLLSSVVEQWSSKPEVESSILSVGNYFHSSKTNFNLIEYIHTNTSTGSLEKISKLTI